ncbi:sce7726 family protein [Stenotrophomonas sp.]|uniref:sce7726 family protein n=1 Tax=Stenotrophomonas sp. TaxID=69392 RepID=UPI0031D42B51
MKANELELKARALNTLRADRRITRASIISSELPLPERGIRADLAISTGTRLIGVEIKSDFDSLRRLDRQLKAYTEAFDQTILLLGEKHANTINPDIYSHVHIWAIEGDRINKIQSPDVGLPRKRPSKNRREMLEKFNQRFRETSVFFWSNVLGRKINARDVLLLSRYYEVRAEREKQKQDLIDLWTSWNKDFEP